MAIVRIGERERGGDAVDSLLACHERIRSFLALAVRVGEPGGTAGEVAEAGAGIARYFLEAMPLHVADEEDSILPRLLGRDAAVDRALAEMRAQHAAHEAGLARLIAAADAMAADPAAPLSRREVAASGRALEAELAPHLELEESIVFPALRRLLAARELADLADDIRARRDH